jgi:hypothetical protein
MGTDVSPWMVAAIVPRRLKEGEVLIRQGEPTGTTSDTFFIIHQAGGSCGHPDCLLIAYQCTFSPPGLGVIMPVCSQSRAITGSVLPQDFAPHSTGIGSPPPHPRVCMMHEHSP